MESPKKLLRLGDKLLDLRRPRLMGILNLTPDSFYDGGRYYQEEVILSAVARMWAEGADVIDVGGYSTRPGAAEVPLEEELHRVLPVIRLIKHHFPEIALAIDTFRSEVARQAVAAGAVFVNDVSGGQADPEMFATVAALQVPYVLMHMRGTPQTMAQATHYQDFMSEICRYFGKRVYQLQELGVKDIVLDVGFGFAKNLKQNYYLLRHLHVFEELGLPLLVGVSRKSMIYKVLESSPGEALNGTTALHMLALQKGAAWLRVHDVKAAAEAIQLWTLYANTQQTDVNN
ncbi:MAG: dihydropteroate synthase [Microscillaceae bacterium]|nr:dihydropteroate synthase [Microscillaceae bacterium]